MAIKPRWSLAEYGGPEDIVSPIAESTGLSRKQVNDLLLSCGERVRQVLCLSRNPISVSGDGVRAVDVAGLLRVAPGVEIEIAPKFLGLDAANPKWREDFFFLATLSQHGRLLPTERLTASSGERGDLHTLVARAMTDMFWDNHRRPLRSYRTERFADFAFDGDVDPEEIIQPGPDGYEQTTILYDRANSYNATILAAAREILPNLREPSVIAKLERMIQALTPQRRLPDVVRSRRLPSRSKRWQPLYDLSVEILRGFGLSFKSGNAHAPGYLLKTWRVWEDFLGTALQLGLSNSRVRLQKPSILGWRHRIVNGKVETVTSATVTPDAIVSDAAGQIKFLVDAKYKGNIRDGKTRISESDFYESMAFMRPTQCTTTVLVYPTLSYQGLSLGEVREFERILVDDFRIIGVEAETKGISSAGGLMRFAKTYAANLEAIVSAV